MSEHKGLSSYISDNAGTIDVASGNVGKPSVEQAPEGAPRRPVVPAPAVPIINGKPLGSERLQKVPTAAAIFAASIMKKDLGS